jgi:peptidoglycan/xylan/chitin deacetylase (PgdA/CDA1 family)
MQAGGMIELAAHTHTHDDFRYRPSELESDLQMNSQELQNRFGIDRTTFAFPYGVVRDGYAGGPLSEVARDAGLRCALSTEPELVHRNQDPFSWGRFPAEQHDTAATLAAKLGGWSSILRSMKHAARGWFPK